MTSHRILRYRPENRGCVPGIAVPGFIKNGDTYYLTTLDTYADGVVDCWGGVDLDFLAQKFACGWIRSAVPDGSPVSAHDLLMADVRKSSWLHSADSLHAHLKELIRQLNPAMENLVDFEGSDVEIREGARYKKLGLIKSSPVQLGRTDDSPPGKSRNIMIREGNQYYLCQLHVYADGSIDVHPRYGQERLVDLTEFERLMGAGEITGRVAEGTKVEIETLGWFEAAEVNSTDRTGELLKEVRDTLNQLNGEPWCVVVCRQAFQEYLEHPTGEMKLRLKSAYEAVPEHHRMYVGDMDTKDIPVRMILYGEDEIENWSHRLVARARGDDELPMIEIPEPNDDEE